METFRETPKEFDLAILDVSMPGMNGPELARSLRDIRPDLRIILCTGFVDDDLAIDARRQGMEVIVKPFRPREFARKIRTVLDDRSEMSISKGSSGG